ncbi:MAG: hypothetical protein KatS3mg111_2619 [Pirellulaceae bacterium]|nr:MAG: hypothetical protein KatS3mg111_2619 [Pirellulaceae bacterium]
MIYPRLIWSNRRLVARLPYVAPHGVASLLRYRWTLLLGIGGLLLGGTVGAADRQDSLTGPAVDITFKTEYGIESTTAEEIQKYADGSRLILTPDGQLWTLLAEEILSCAPSSAVFRPWSGEELYHSYQQRLPPGFQVFKTRHFVIVYNTSDAYAKWAGELFERLYRGFYNFWEKDQHLQLREPRFPLPAVVFRDQESYLQYARREIGDAAAAMIGYYNMKTNVIVSYDLTGVNGMVPRGTRIASSRVINQILSRPQAERTVATIVHEAVHQLAYNSGMQTRLADNPLWLSEGLAMFFEAPDLRSNSGWRMGQVNYHNLRLFSQYLPQRPADSLITLLSSDERLRESQLAKSAYPEAWALTYFLIKTRRDAFASYLAELSQLPPLGESSPRERLELFQKHFGEDVQELDVAFVNYMRRLR